MESRAHVGWRFGPHHAVADAFERVEAAIECAVRRGAKGRPVERIEHENGPFRNETGTLLYGVLLWSFFAISAALVTFAALASRNRALCLRVRLLRRREADGLDGVLAYCAASRLGVCALLEVLAQRVRSLDPCSDVVAAFVPDLDELRCTFVSGIRGEHLPGLRLSRTDERRLPSIAAARARRALADGGLLTSDRRSLAVPLRDDDMVAAVIYVATTRASFGDVDALVAAIERCSIPYALACERERDVANATFDGLTGLLSPQAFRTRLHDEIAAMRASEGDAAALLFVDTDEFKNVNDTLGHQAGDAVLRQMADILRSHAVRDVDVVARNGGDEFCALLHNVPKTRAIERARALCAAVRSHDFGVGRAMSASVGVAAFPLDALTSKDLLELADAAMYFSKRAGRDRASFATSPDRFVACER